MIEKEVRFFKQMPLPLKVLDPVSLDASNGVLIDQLQRPLRDLRISVTDRCNFRCVYCMPKQVFNNQYVYLPQSALLTFDEIVRLARLAVARGVEKIRLTGGEPLLRKDIARLIAMLANLRTPEDQAVELTLTTNGSLLKKMASSLKDAGLHRVTVSLDAISDPIFKRMNDVNYAVGDVLDGIDAAHVAGLGPVKVNMVVKRGWNEEDIVPMARHFKATPSILRFIEFMDVGSSNGWHSKEVISSQDIIQKIHAEMPLVRIPANYIGETAERWRYVDGGEIGVISSVTKAFCTNCTRIRLSTDGKLYTCLFATSGHDIRGLLRSGVSDAEISASFAAIWQTRNDRYSEMRGQQIPVPSAPQQKVEMSYIGG